MTDSRADRAESAAAAASTSFLVRQITERDKVAFYDLRGRVLRPGLPPDAARFPGDDDAETIHLGAFRSDTGQLVGIATLVRNKGVQLRGMATDPSVRGSGAGRELLQEVHRIAQTIGLPLWCNARRTAVGFYEKQGWRTEGNEFEIPGVGPHSVMRYGEIPSS